MMFQLIQPRVLRVLPLLSLAKRQIGRRENGRDRPGHWSATGRQDIVGGIDGLEQREAVGGGGVAAGPLFVGADRCTARRRIE